MSPRVTVVDYGSGNLFSVARALETCGATVTLCSTPEGVRAADRVVLPGVGAFATGMHGLQTRGLDEALVRYAALARPLLGICLGMQMLFDRSSEFGDHSGLGLIAGRIDAIAPGAANGRPLKVPHIGWSALVEPPGRAWKGSILDGLDGGARAYFVHSFTAVPAREDDRLADTQYGASRIAAAVARDHISGCQFHPEKSGAVGLAVIRTFLEARS